MKEKRKHTRLPIEKEAEIVVPGRDVYIGITRSMSFGGVFVELNQRLDIDEDDRCEVSVVLQDELERITIDFKCRVAHSNQGGIGFQFISVSFDHYTHFRNLMVANSPEPEKLLEELEKYPGLIITGMD